jgi:acyl transferase domain-containing protein
MLTKLPPYSFNHSQRIWYESRLSKNFRNRKHPRHDLFGAPVPDWNPDQPEWRHFLRLPENPWMKDHVVTGSYVYPGVGYIIMAIEASAQISDPNLKLKGFQLRDISIKSALIIPDTKDGVETRISLSPMDESSLENSKIWKRWRVSSYNPTGTNWIEHCTGYITTEYEATPGPVDGGIEAEAEAQAWKNALKESYDRCKTPSKVPYDDLETIGLAFGRLFQNLAGVKANEETGEVTATVCRKDTCIRT